MRADDSLVSRRQALRSVAGTAAALALTPRAATASEAALSVGPEDARRAPEPLASVADFERAVDAGVFGLIVSNHGARNLDTVPASVAAIDRTVLWT